jgi:hypothetical protein
MRLTKIQLLVILLLTLFIISCGGQQSSTMKTNYKQGYKGLVINTLENFPPSTLYPNSKFRITVKLANQGAYKATNGKITIQGFDDKYISLSKFKDNIYSLSGNYYLEGKSATNPSGDFNYVEFDARTNTLFPGSDSYSATYFIKTEYDYKTEFTNTVCLNPNMYEVKDAGCKTKSSQSFSGQGSPLAVSSMEQITYPGAVPRVEFRVNMMNQGRGKVQKVKLNKAQLGGKNIKCDFKNNLAADVKTFTFKEDKQKTTLICKQTLNTLKSYSTVLHLDFSLSYKLEEKKSLTIKK